MEEVKPEFEERKYLHLESRVHSESEEVSTKISRKEAGDGSRGDVESYAPSSKAENKSSVREMVEHLENLLSLKLKERESTSSSSEEDMPRKTSTRRAWGRGVKFAGSTEVYYRKRRRTYTPPKREIPLKSILRRRKRTWNVRQLYNLEESIDEGFCTLYLLLALLLLQITAGVFLLYYSQNIYFKFDCCSWKLMKYVSPCINDLSILLSGIYSSIIVVLSVFSFICIIIMRGRFVAYLILAFIIILGISISSCIFILRSCDGSPEAYLLGICGSIPKGYFNNETKTLEYALDGKLVNCWNEIEDNHNCCGWHTYEDWKGSCHKRVSSQKITTDTSKNAEPLNKGCYELFKKTAATFIFVLSITWLFSNFIIILALIIMLL